MSDVSWTQQVGGGGAWWIGVRVTRAFFVFGVNGKAVNDCHGKGTEVDRKSVESHPELTAPEESRLQQELDASSCLSSVLRPQSFVVLSIGFPLV